MLFLTTSNLRGIGANLGQTFRHFMPFHARQGKERRPQTQAGSQQPRGVGEFYGASCCIMGVCVDAFGFSFVINNLQGVGYKLWGRFGAFCASVMLFQIRVSSPSEASSIHLL